MKTHSSALPHSEPAISTPDSPAPSAAGPELVEPGNRPASAFTRLELAATVAALVLLAMVACPLAANQRPRSHRVTCFNNLRQVGLAMEVWASDHGGRRPQEIPTAEGGTRQHPLAPNTWLHFSKLSNELAFARSLLCPSDTGQPARDFTGDPTGGYLHPNFANRATSYFVAYSQLNEPREILAGDRNIRRPYSLLASCDRFNLAMSVSIQGGRIDAAWGTNLHNAVGNSLLADGRVFQMSTLELQSAVVGVWRLDWNITTKHLAVPR